MRQLKNVHIADGATIGGKRDIQLRVRKSRFTRPSFYFFQAVWLAAAMLVGWLGLVLFPGFFQASTQAVGSGWRSLGLGFAVIAGVPFAILVTAFTLVGLPVSFMLLALYLAGSTWQRLGGSLPWPDAFEAGRGHKGRLAAGTTAGPADPHHSRFIPYLGGLFHVGVLCLGLGAFAWQLYRASRPL